MDILSATDTNPDRPNGEPGQTGPAASSAGRPGPALSDDAVGHAVPAPSAAFFARLFHALDHDYPPCATLIALLALQADLGFVPASRRDLAAALGCTISDRHIGRALKALEGQRLIECRRHPNATTRYRVVVTVLRALLDAPLSQAEVMPGLTALPALDRLPLAPADADSSLDPERYDHE